MTHVIVILALMSAWIHKITPESSIIPYHCFTTPGSLCVYPSLVYQIISLLHRQQHCWEGYSAHSAQMNTWKGSYAYNIALLTANLAAVSWYNTLSWIYMCPSSGYTTYEDSYFSSIDIKLSRNPRNSAVTHQVLQILHAAPILCHAVTSNAWAFTHNSNV